MIAALPPEHSIVSQFRWGLQRSSPAVAAPTRSPLELFPAHQRLESRDPRSLAPDEAAQLWSGAANALRTDLLLRLFDAGVPRPRRWNVGCELARALVEDDRTEQAALVLISIRDNDHLGGWWECLPWTPPLDPVLRRAITPEVMDQWLGDWRSPG